MDQAAHQNAAAAQQLAATAHQMAAQAVLLRGRVEFFRVDGGVTAPAAGVGAGNVSEAASGAEHEPVRSTQPEPREALQPVAA